MCSDVRPSWEQVGDSGTYRRSGKERVKFSSFLAIKCVENFMHVWMVNYLLAKYMYMYISYAVKFVHEP